MNAKACMTVASREVPKLLQELGLKPTADGGFSLTQAQLELLYAMGVQEGWGRGYAAGTKTPYVPRHQRTEAHGKMESADGPRVNDVLGQQGGRIE